MRIIVLEGMPNKGKTHTMWLLRDILTSLAIGGVSTALTIYGSGIVSPKNDFEDIIINYKSLKIGIYSQGDYSNYLASEIRKFEKLGCDVLVCTLSLNTLKINANKAINRFSNTRVPKTVEPIKALQINANNADASAIFSLI
jgi:hypothetical protein